MGTFLYLLARSINLVLLFFFLKLSTGTRVRMLVDNVCLAKQISGMRLTCDKPEVPDGARMPTTTYNLDKF